MIPTHTTKKGLFYGFGGLLAVIIIVVGMLVWPHVRGVWFAVRSSQIDIADVLPAVSDAAKTSTSTLSAPSFPLHLPSGFSIGILAKNIPGARVIAQDELGNFWISQTSVGRITHLELSGGQVTRQEIALSGLKNPHGLAFDPKNPNDLYIATEQALYRYRVYTPGAKLEKVLDLPAGGRHFTRTLLFGTDGILYISIGSDCDVCFEKDARLASIQTADVHATRPRLTPFATGLRNSVFMAWHPISKELWATEMGRDFLGDTLPPDEINIIKKGLNYGWPLCYGDAVHDKNFDNRPLDPCSEPLSVMPQIDLPAHSAPLGLAFVANNTAWPKEWGNDVLVVLHGSWNSTQPVGYKVVRVHLDAEGRPYGTEDFITGWITGKDTLGRPVDLLFGVGTGNLYISDDKAGIIYQVLAPQI